MDASVLTVSAQEQDTQTLYESVSGEMRTFTVYNNTTDQGMDTNVYVKMETDGQTFILDRFALAPGQTKRWSGMIGANNILKVETDNHYIQWRLVDESGGNMTTEDDVELGADNVMQVNLYVDD